MIRAVAGLGRRWRAAHEISSFGSDTLFTATISVLLALVGVATSIGAARLLGPDGRGSLAAIQIWPATIGTLAMLGLPDALAFYAAREPRRAGEYLGSALAFALPVSGLFILVGAMLLPVLLSAQTQATIAAARWYLLLVPLLALVGMPYQVLRGRSDFVRWNVMRTATPLGWLVVIVLGWLLQRSSPHWFAAGHLAVLALLIVPVNAVVARRVGGPFRPRAPLCPPLLRFGVPSMLGGIPQLLNARLDQMMMAALLAPALLGLYIVAVAWSGVISPLLSALAYVLLPRVASRAAVDDQHAAFAQGIRLATSVAVVMVSVVLLVTPWGLTFLFGPPFAPAVPAALVLVGTAGLAGLNGVMEEGLRGLGVPAAIISAELAGLLITAGSLLLLLRPLGIVGAAMALLLGQATVWAILLAQAGRRTRLPVTTLLMPARAELRLGWERIRALARVVVR